MKTLQTNITYIYNLSSSDEPNNVRYIGKSDTPNIRIKKHIQESKRLNSTHKHRWINKKISQGYEIKINILKIVNKMFWKNAEIFFINSFQDYDLTNFAKGGNGGCPSKYTYSYSDTKNWIKKNINANSSREWFKLTKENKIPDFIPNAPQDVYNKEWISWNDFLDSNNKKPSDYKYITLNESKKYVNENFKVKSKLEWRDLVLSGKIPESIPSRPERYYKNRGWTSWGDFFGTDNKGTHNVEYLNYNDAKKYVQNNFKNIKTEKLWRELVKNKLIPSFIPGTPQRYYNKKGWINWYDWFGKSF
jgi:hypothetical protein